MTKRDEQIRSARESGYRCDLRQQVHFNCEHGDSLLSTEKSKRNDDEFDERGRYLGTMPTVADVKALDLRDCNCGGKINYNTGECDSCTEPSPVL